MLNYHNLHNMNYYYSYFKQNTHATKLIEMYVHSAIHILTKLLKKKIL